MAVILGHRDCFWMDPSQIGLHRGIDSDARDIHCDSILVPIFVNDRGGPAFVLMSPRGTSFARRAALTHLNL